MSFCICLKLLNDSVSILGIIFGNKCFDAGRIKDGYIGLEQSIKRSIEDYLNKLDDAVCDSPVISAVNSRACNNVEKELGEMRQLIWRLTYSI